MSGERVTYVSIGSSPEFDRDLEAALAAVARELPVEVRPSSGGPGCTGRSPLASPADRRRIVAMVATSSAADVDEAVCGAAAAYPAWRARPWHERVALVRAAADRLADGKFRTAALLVHEVGKTRLEAMAEVEEAADLLRYYAGQLEAAGGYRRQMARAIASEVTESVLLPYGVWAVISPFNFPMALAAGMAGAALLTGNTVVFKPSEEAALSGAILAGALWEAGVPREALQLVLGGEAVGRALVGHSAIAGVAFTGSSAVGMAILRTLPRDYPRPAAIEMGGKNPAIVAASADVEAAAVAVARSAFGYGGQKCSACSRAYVERGVYDRFLERLAGAARAMKVGPPERKETAVGPLIDERAVERFVATVARVREAGGEILVGGSVLADGDLAHGHYVEPTVATLPDAEHALWDEELFVPLLLVRPVADLAEGIALANRSRHGLTAGLFAGRRAEIDRFLDGIEAGVVYVNRKSGATTGAWPGVNSFGGWKGSGGTGVAALGPHYLLKFLREQSRAVSEGEGEGEGRGQPA
jgi:1-pyrroline-5-carboxylate dehydrogenase